MDGNQDTGSAHRPTAQPSSSPSTPATLLCPALRRCQSGGSAECPCSCAGWLDTPPHSPAWGLLAGIAALRRPSCCPPAGPLAPGPGCQPAGRGGSLAGSQLPGPELSSRRQARRGQAPMAPEQDPSQASAPRGPRMPAPGKALSWSPAGPGSRFSAQPFTMASTACGLGGIFESNHNKNSNNYS